MEWGPGDVGGLLPFSRLQKSPGLTKMDEASELLMVEGGCFPEMITRCQELTGLLVHVMLDRALLCRRIVVFAVLGLGLLGAGGAGAAAGAGAGCGSAAGGAGGSGVGSGAAAAGAGC